MNYWLKSDRLPAEDHEKLQKMSLLDRAYSNALSNVVSFINRHRDGDRSAYNNLLKIKEIEDKKLQPIIIDDEYNNKNLEQLGHFYLMGFIDSSMLKTLTRQTQERLKELIRFWAEFKHKRLEDDIKIPKDIDSFGCEYKYACGYECEWCYPYSKAVDVYWNGKEWGDK